ncbi:MAG: glycosyltransferase [Aquabacterium sp.]
MARAKVLMLADQPQWAYHMIATYVAACVGSAYDVYIDFTRFHRPARAGLPPWRPGRWRAALQHGVERLRWRRATPDGHYDVAIHLGWYFDAAADLRRIRARRTVKGLYTQGFPPQGMEVDPNDHVRTADLDRTAFIHRYLEGAAAVVCGAPIIQQDWQPALHMPCHYANLALDERAYSPAGRRPNDPAELVVGWTGNPDRAFKGFNSHVVPAVEAAARQRPGIRLKTRFSGPPETLPQFYKDVDVALIASSADAGPAMFLEAALSGVPAVSTRIGVVDAVLQDGVNGLAVPREVEAMAQALVRLYDDRALLQALSQRVRDDCIAKVGHAVQQRAWRALLEEVLDAPAP